MRIRLFFIVAVGLLAVAVYTFPMWAEYIYGEEVVINSPIAGLSPEQAAGFERLPQNVRNAYLELNEVAPSLARVLVQARIVGDVPVPPENQTMPQSIGEPTVLTRVPFVEFELTYQEIALIYNSSGTVAIYQMPDDRLLLRLEGFRIDNAPNLHVVLSRSAEPRTAEDIGNYLDLGELQGTVGDQNYFIPEGADLELYRSVAIYSPQVGLVFAIAPLE